MSDTITTSITVSSGFAAYLLAQLRCASVRSRLLTAEIDSIGVTLRGNVLSVEDAIKWADDLGVLNLTVPSTLASSA